MLPILHQSLWRDEAVSVFVAEKSLNEIFSTIIKDVQGPFYYFLLHYWMILFGNSEVAIRSLSVIFHLALGVLIFFFIYRLTRSIWASILSSLAVLFNAFLLSYSFEARPYSLLSLFITLAFYLIFTKRYIFASLIISLSLITHNFAFLYLLGLGIYWLFIIYNDLKDKNKTAIKRFLALFTLPIITTFLWGNFVIKQWGRVVESFWINPTTSGIFLETFEKFFSGPIDIEGKTFTLTIALILGAFVLSFFITHREDKADFPIMVLPIAAFLPIVASYLISSVWVPNFHERYVIASIPLLIIFSAVSLYRLILKSSRNLSYFIISFIILYLVSSIQLTEKIVRTPTKPPVNYAVNEILKNAKEGDIILPKEYVNFLETKYYIRKANSLVPIYALSQAGEILWYANAVFIDPQEIIRELPKDKRIWQVNPNGSYELLIQ